MRNVHVIPIIPKAMMRASSVWNTPVTREVKGGCTFFVPTGKTCWT